MWSKMVGKSSWKVVPVMVVAILNEIAFNSYFKKTYQNFFEEIQTM